MRKFTGQIYWMTGNYKSDYLEAGINAKINRAILEENIFKIDHQNPDGAPDSLITLRSKDGFNFDGSMKFMDEKNHAAIVNLKMYENKKNILLIGDWIENKEIYNCIIEMLEVKEFKK